MGSSFCWHDETGSESVTVCKFNRFLTVFVQLMTIILLGLSNNDELKSLLGKPWCRNSGRLFQFLKKFGILKNHSSTLV